MEALTNLVLAWLLKGAVLLALAGLALLLSRRSTAAMRRLVCGLAVVGSLGVVGLVATGARVSLPGTAPARATLGNVAESVLASAPTPASAAIAELEPALSPSSGPTVRRLPTVALLGFLVVGLALLLRIVSSLRAAGRLFEHAAPAPHELWTILERAKRTASVDRDVELRISDEVSTPMALGLVRPALVLPAAAATWEIAQLEHALVHELIHVRRRDPLLRVMAQVMRALHWPNPLAWWLTARLDRELEHAVDDQVLVRLGCRPSAYAASLLAVATGRPTAAGAVMAERSSLDRRVTAVLDPSARRGGPGRIATGLLFVGASAIATMVACADLDDERSPSAAATTGTSDVAPMDSTRDRMAALQHYVDEEAAFLVAEHAAKDVRIVVLGAQTGVLLGAYGENEVVYPGSVMKPFLLATAIEAGLDPEATIDTREPGLHEWVQRDHVRPGLLTITEVLATSSNLGALKVYDGLDPALLTADWSLLGLQPREIEDRSVRMALGVDVALPARTLARAFTVFANDGQLAVPPHDGNFERSDACVPASGPQIYSPGTARAVHRMLRAVVESPRGTGQRAHLAYSAAGKTGTVAVEMDGESTNHSTFVGIAPADNPRVIVLVSVVGADADQSPTGGRIAAPSFGRLAEVAVPLSSDGGC